jgi:hypothetical protein
VSESFSNVPLLILFYRCFRKSSEAPLLQEHGSEKATHFATQQSDCLNEYSNVDRVAQDFHLTMKKQKRHILLFLKNAPVHPPDVQLDNIKLMFFDANTTATIQPLDQGIIRTFKAHYGRDLVEHIMVSAGSAMAADDVTITALNAVC